MIFDQSESKESQTIEALIPMVDLFAVLAIVFMIYSNDEVQATRLESAKKIEQIVAEVEDERGLCRPASGSPNTEV